MIPYRMVQKLLGQGLPFLSEELCLHRNPSLTGKAISQQSGHHHDYHMAGSSQPQHF